ncbi:hypothetical protein [Longimicrobium sp.]|uniref:hypothetical protein n=1 Tax=Longimicrobium sp. TaxID=2029185 RepID=UPI002BD0E62F|nr:hypothetical protein [Longimicrobium sp.]HSU16558.1 hypothetical protein [Longimicrobium sp.]
MIRTLLRGAAPAALLAAVIAGPAAGQSLLASRGLGYPLEPIDARSRGLGGVTTGLSDPFPSLVNPASAAGIPAPSFIVTLQNDHYDATAGAERTSGSTARFPQLLGVFPVSGRLALQLGYGSYLDQHWQVARDDSITLSTGRTAVNDRFISAGGVARFQGGVGYRLNEKISVGASLDVFTGAANDSVVRTITGLESVTSAVTYTYTGVQVGGGVRFQPLTNLSLSAAVHGGGHVRASSDSTGTERKDYANPLTVDAGASTLLGGRTMIVASGHWARWSALDGDLSATGGARDASSVSAGVEYTGFQLFRKVLPLRVGGRYAQLPFRWTGTDPAFPNERAITAGLGWRFAGRGAAIDIGGERGWRGGTAAGIDEPYWRFAFSVQVLGR